MFALPLAALGLVVAQAHQDPRPFEDSFAELRGSDPFLAARARAELSKAPDEYRHHLDRLLDGADASEMDRRAALQLLGSYGPSALPSLERIEDQIHEPGLAGKQAILALGEIAPFAEATRREECTQMLSRLHQRPRTARDLTRELERSLARLSMDVQASNDRLIAALGGDNTYVLEFAAELLGRRGEAAEKALPALHALTTRSQFPRATQLASGETIRNGSGAAARNAAADAILAIQPHGTYGLEAWRRQLGSHDPFFRRDAAMALGRFGERAAIAATELAQRLTDLPPVAREAATALGMIGPSASAAHPHLVTATASADEQLAARARHALRQLEPR